MRPSQPRSVFFVVLVLGVAAITLFWSLASKTDEEAVAPDFGGVYIEGVVGSPARVNPLFARENAVDRTLTALVFAGLTRLDHEGLPFPDMAETWSLSPDQLTYTFTLRQNLRWHDGMPVTSDDVLFTYGLLADPGLPIPPAAAGILAAATVSAPDDLTVVVRLRAPYSALPAYLTLGILPRHILDGLTLVEVYDSFFNQNPVGSGPYRLARLTPSEAELEANHGYHFDQPFLQDLELQFYRNEAALRLALEAGEVTAAFLRGALAEALGLKLNGGSELRLTPLDTGEITYVYLNLEKLVFQDRRVRQALLYALDREALIQDGRAGAATVAQSPISPASWAYSPSLRRYESDSNLAGLLLDEAGWVASEDGLRRLDGQPLEFTLAVDNDVVRVGVAHQVAEAWNDLGLRVHVTEFGLSELLRDQLEPRDYEAVLWTAAPAPDPDPYERWHSSGTEGEGANLTGFSHPRVDALLEEGLRVSLPKRRELYLEFQEVFAQEVPAIPLYVAMATYVQESSLQGVRVALVTEPGDRFWQVQDWFVRTR